METQSLSKPKSRSSAFNEGKPRRPRTFPKTFTRKLELVGVKAPPERISDTNLKVLISQLSSELEHHRMQADIYQNMLAELRKGNRYEKEQEEDQHSTSSRLDSGSPTQSTRPSSARTLHSSPRRAPCETTDDASSPPPDHAGEGKVEFYFSPLRAVSKLPIFLNGNMQRLEMPNILNPFSLGLPNVISTMAKLPSDHVFHSVLRAFDFMSIPFGLTSVHDDTQFGNIAKVKPDFTEQKARELWNGFFEPINAPPSQFMLGYGPNSRQNTSLSDDYDPDMDYMDRKLANMSDAELVDVLQYCTVFMGGLDRISPLHPDLEKARGHITKNCERLLREATFTRNILDNPLLARSLLDAIVLLISYFAVSRVSTLVLSLMAFAWQVNVQYKGMVHPSTRGLLSCLHSLIAPTSGARTRWMRISMDNLEETSNRYFQLTSMTYLAGTYHSIINTDEGTLHTLLQNLDDMLAPGHTEAYADPEGVLEPWDLSMFHPVPSLANSSFSSSTTRTTTTTPTTTTVPFSSTPSCASYSHPSTSSASEPSSPSDFTPWNPYLNTDVSTAVAPTGELCPEELRTNPAEVSVIHGFILERTPAYRPPEQLKSILRVSVALVRADAALWFGDDEGCRYWVDEAERILRAILVRCATQRIFLLKHLFKTTCTFATGTRTVVDEFERRIIALEAERRPEPVLLSVVRVPRADD